MEVDGNPDNIPQLDGCGKKEVSSDDEEDEDESAAEEEDREGDGDDDDEEECTDDNDNNDEVCCPEDQCDCLPPESCHNLGHLLWYTEQQPLTPDEPPNNDCSLCSRSMEPGEAVQACTYCHFAKCSECIRGAAMGQD